MMQLVCKSTTLVLVVFLLASCGGQKTAGLQEGAEAPDKTLFENGMRFLEKSSFIKARLAFQTLINTYPDSEYTPVSFLSIADSYYDEGGTANLLQAESQYKDFIIFYPLHEMADDSQMKIAAVNVRLMRSPDRDTTFAKKAEQELAKFLDTYPDSELGPTAQEFLREVQENLAVGIQGVADFYFEKDSYLASESRYKEILEKYPRFRRLDDTLAYLGQSLERLGRVEEASVYYARLISEYPFSGHADGSREKLILLEKPLPPVDTVKAAHNESNRKAGEKGFSVLDPVRGVWGIFTGREDPYEVARRRAEAARAAQQVSNQDPQLSGQTTDP